MFYDIRRIDTRIAKLVKNDKNTLSKVGKTAEGV